MEQTDEKCSGFDLIKPGACYPVFSPYDEYVAAAALLEALAREESKVTERDEGRRMEQVTNQAVAVLREFFAAMRQWELDCKFRSEEAKKGNVPWDDKNKLDLDQLRQIFDKYCICTRRFPVGVTYSDPPSNDPDARVVEITERGTKTFIVIERKALPCTLKYSVVDTDAGPKVSDQVKAFDQIKQKFVSFNILL